jgi:hypothetical protein
MNFMIHDVFGVGLAFLVFPLFVVVPGYVVAWGVDLFGFRTRRLTMRFLIGLTLSIALVPVVIYLLERLTGRWGVWALFGLVWVVFLAQVIREPQFLRYALEQPLFAQRRTRNIAALLLCCWLIIGTFSLIDLQIGDRLLWSTTTYDYQTRSAATASIVRWGVPLINPEFYPGAPQISPFHPYWFQLCSFPAQPGLPFVTARIVVIASVLWVGVALMGTIALFLRFRNAQDIERRALTGIALLGVSGLDILLIMALGRMYFGYLVGEEGWNGDSQVVTWLGTLIWVPNHIAALVAGIMSVLLLRQLALESETKRRILLSLLAAAGIASALGTGVYVGLVFAVFLIVWAGRALLIRSERPLLGWLILTGLLAIALSIPYAIDIVRAPQTNTQPAFMLWVRAFGPLVLGDTPQANVIYLALLPFNYGIEFGFYAIAGWLWWRRSRRQSGVFPPEALLLISSLLIITFIKSGAGFVNDLGWRGMLPVQFILLIWAVELFQTRIRQGTRLLLVGTATLGALTTVLFLTAIRFNHPLAEIGFEPRPPELIHDDQFSRRVFHERALYTHLRETLPPHFIIQMNPSYRYETRAPGLYSERQLVGVIYGQHPPVGAPAAWFDETIRPIQKVFAESSSLNDARALCQLRNIDVLVARDLDPVWQQPDSWVWVAPPDAVLYDSKFARAIRCGSP